MTDPKVDMSQLVERLRATEANCNFGSTLCARDAHAAADLLSRAQPAGLVEADRVVAAFEAFNDAEHNRQDCPECGNEGPWHECAQCSDTVGDLLNAHLLAIEVYKATRAATNARDMAEFGASEAACYRYHGEDQQAERAAFCAGAAHAVTQPAPTDTADRREAVDRMGRLAGRLVANGDARISRLGACHELDAIASLIAGPLPEGFVAVPVEPTEAMLTEAVDNAGPIGCCNHTAETARATWSAMIASRPTGES